MLSEDALRRIADALIDEITKMEKEWVEKWDNYLNKNYGLSIR